ncbi:MAG TPA: DUF4136 domain-containing protein [Allosphingosinicella sp.]|nr:DUF4136 domain-containing protein [Allosphingosinicella sp.]
MKTAFLRSAALGAAMALAACSTGGAQRGATSAGAVEVARFHLGAQPMAHAQIALMPFDKDDAARPGFADVAAAVSRQLIRLGWTVVPTTSQSEQIALIDFEQGNREAISALTAGRIGRGVAPGPQGGPSAGRTATLLEVAIRRRSDGTVFWEGRAVTEAPTGSAATAPAAASDRLATALFRDFPGESGRSIRVK